MQPTIEECIDKVLRCIRIRIPAGSGKLSAAARDDIADALAAILSRGW